MKQLHAHLCEIMGRDDADDPLWKHIFFREDCTYDYDERGKIFHHKDLTKYNRDLSKVIIVDNSSLSYKSLEPNAILIADFFGKDCIDNELDIVLELLYQINDIESQYENVYIDYRYLLTSIITDAHQFDKFDFDIYNRRNPDDMILSTERFLNDLKEHLIKNQKLPTTLKFGEPPKDLSDVLSDHDEDDNAIYMHKSQSPSLESSVTNEVKETEGLATPIGDYKQGLEDVSEAMEEMKINDPLEDSITSSDSVRYSISLRLQDIPHFNNMDEMETKSLEETESPRDVDHGIGSRTNDDDDSDDDDDNDDDDDLDDTKEEEKMESYRHVRRFSTMAPHPNQLTLASGLASVSLKVCMYATSER